MACLWLLKMGAKVSGISFSLIQKKSFDSLDIKELNHIICDIRDREKLKNHLLNSARSCFPPCCTTTSFNINTEPVRGWEVNVLGTINLLDILEKQK